MKKLFILLQISLCLSSSAQIVISDQSVRLSLNSLKTAKNGLKVNDFDYSRSIDCYQGDRYSFRGGKIWGLVGIAAGSFIWYAKERYEFQGRRYFEIKHGADPYGFWGSKSHIRVRDKLIKDDFYHVANTGGKYLIIGSSVWFGVSAGKQNKKKFIYYVYDVLIIGATSITFSFLGDRTMNLYR